MRAIGAMNLALLAVIVPMAGGASAKPVVRVGSTAIHKERIDSLVELLAQQQAPDRSLTPQERRYLERLVAGNLVGQELLIQEARAGNIDVPDADIDSLYEEFAQGFPSRKDFEQAIAKAGDDSTSLRQKLRKQLVIEKLLAKRLTPIARPSEDSMREYFKTHKKELPRNDSLRASQILITLGKRAGSAEEQKARAVLETIREALILEPHLDVLVEKFALTALRHSQGPEAKSGGDLKRFHPDDFLPEFHENIRDMEVGEISKIFRTQLGLHLVLVTERFDGRFESYRLGILQAMAGEQNAKNQVKLQDYLSDLVDKHEVDYLDPSYAGNVSADLDGVMAPGPSGAPQP